MIDFIIGVYKRNEKLIKDNIFLAAGMLVFGAAGYLFHFYAGRKLGPENYGVLGALLSILYIATIIILFVQLAITKYVSNLREKKQEGKITYLLKHSRKKYWLYGLATAIIILALTPLMRFYLKMDLWVPFIIIAVLMTFSYVLSLNIGIIQGLQNFKGMMYIYFGEGITKVLAGVLLISIGFGVAGGMGAFGLSYLIGLLITIPYLGRIKRRQEEKIEIRNILMKSMPLLIVLSSLSLMYSIDVLLVKHYLQLAEAGYYTAISTLGKIVFFASNSVSFVMFPKISTTKTERENRYTLYKSLILIALIAVPIILFYFLFPEFVIRMLFGSEYLAVKEFVFLFAVVMLLYSIIYTLCFYNLSLNKTKFIYILLISNVAQITAIILLHKSVQQVVYVMLTFMAALLITLFVIRERKNETPLTHHTGIQ